MHVKYAWGVALMLASLSVAAQQRILIALPPAYDFESEATAALRKDCALAERVSKQVLASVKERFPSAEAIDDWRKAGDAPVVRVWITQLQPAVPSNVIRADSVSRMGIRAELYEASERRTFGDWRATSAPHLSETDCPAFERIAASLGKSVAAWVPVALRVSAEKRAAAEAAAKAAQQAAPQ